MPSQIPSAPEPASGAETAGFESGAADVRGERLVGTCGLDEQALVAAVLERDRKAAAELVARYTDPVYSYISRRLAPRAELVEDVVHDVFVVALQKLDSFEGRSSLGGWLLGIARHKVEELYRARLRQHEP